MRPRDVTGPKHHHWGVLPSYREQEGGAGCNREEGKDQRGRCLGEEKCNYGAPCWSGSEETRQGLRQQRRELGKHRGTCHTGRAHTQQWQGEQGSTRVSILRVLKAPLVASTEAYSAPCGATVQMLSRCGPQIRTNNTRILKFRVISELIHFSHIIVQR